MSETAVDFASGAIALAASILGILSLVVTHRASHMATRVAAGALIFLCVVVATDSLFAAILDGVRAERLSVAFCLVLAVSWFCRLVTFKPPTAPPPSQP